MSKDGERHGESRVSCPSTMSLARVRTLDSSAIPMRPPRGFNLMNLHVGGLTPQSWS